MEVALQTKETRHIQLYPFIYLQRVIRLVPDPWSSKQLDYGLPLGLFLVIPLLFCVLEIMELWVCRLGYFMCSRWDECWGSQVLTLHLGLCSCKVGLPNGKLTKLSHGCNFGADSLTSALTVGSIVLSWCSAGSVSQVLKLLGSMWFSFTHDHPCCQTR